MNARDDRGETPLYHTNGAAALVLVDAGADVNARDEDGWTPLYHAVAPFWEESESPTLIGALLAAGAWVNIPGFSPLHRDTNTPAVIKVLLAAGADASARDQEGKTPWDYAQDNEALKGTDAWWRLREGGSSEMPIASVIPRGSPGTFHCSDSERATRPHMANSTHATGLARVRRVDSRFRSDLEVLG